MRYVFILTLLLLAGNLHSQRFAPTTCDSTILTPQELEKCKRDALYDSSIVMVTNYITFLRSELLPRYRVKRKALLFPAVLENELKLLQKVYDSTVKVKLEEWRSDMDRNQSYVQPKAYITTLLGNELFRFYPDVYAVLLNPIHTSLKPKTDNASIERLERWVEDIYAKLPSELKKEVGAITGEMMKTRRGYPNHNILDMLQGTAEEEKRVQYDIINFLLWRE